ncbi:hypothetical protein ANO11243_037680 [Dothideomycetidae sp. 11243]|nr:hypothetical protein ANO11243_037680 [fungal sp. No.11243]
MGSEYCCPGVFQATDTPNGAYCCVGPTDLPLSRFSDCFPNCGVTSTTTTSTDAATQSCATTIMINDPNYSSEVNALGATATPVGSSQPISEHSTINSIPTGSATVTESSGSAASTTGSSSSAASSSASSAGSSSSASGASASSTGTSSSKGLAARITGIPFAGAFMLAGGIAVAAM